MENRVINRGERDILFISLLLLFFLFYLLPIIIIIIIMVWSMARGIGLTPLGLLGRWGGVGGRVVLAGGLREEYTGEVPREERPSSSMGMEGSLGIFTGVNLNLGANREGTVLFRLMPKP